LDASYYSRLGKALQGMRGLTSLEVHVDAGLSWVLPSLSPLADLHHFSCSFGLDKYVASFLACTPCLHSLQLASSSDNIELSTSVIPQLRSYTGPPNLLAQLLPMRPLSALHLCSDLTLDDIAYFTNNISAPSSTPPAHKPPEGVIVSHPTIETLSTITSAQPVAVVEAIAQACPSLVSLQVIASYAFWQAPDMVSSLSLSRLSLQTKRKLTLPSDVLYPHCQCALADAPSVLFRTLRHALGVPPQGDANSRWDLLGEGMGLPTRYAPSRCRRGAQYRERL
jgi:hypothetical protein